MKMRLIGSLLLLLMLCVSATAGEKPVLILTDVSGSMQDAMENETSEKLKKVEFLKELLLRLSKEITCDTGIYQIRYIAGNSERYERFLKIAAHDAKEMQTRIEQDFITDYPVFNRRTPLADALRQLDEQELKKINGEITLLLISDGRESFRDPLSEIRKIKEKYGFALTLHTVFIDRKDKKDGESEAEKLLRDMAAAGGGQHYSGANLLKDSSLLKELALLLCPVQTAKAPEIEKAVPVVKSPETPAPKTAAAAPVIPEPPKSLTVNPKGHWVLGGVLFETAKWTILAHAYPVLDDVVLVMKNNPGLKLEIQGYTDSVASKPYNQKLSERRATAVRNYLVQKGIASERLSVIGFGLTVPVADNATAEGRAKNRRVEFRPISN
jgi:outer membrane protein OmpA-like peptidoglycan-associated protein